MFTPRLTTVRARTTVEEGFLRGIREDGDAQRITGLEILPGDVLADPHATFGASSRAATQDVVDERNPESPRGFSRRPGACKMLAD